MNPIVWSEYNICSFCKISVEHQTDILEQGQGRFHVLRAKCSTTSRYSGSKLNFFLAFICSFIGGAEYVYQNFAS